MRRGRIAAFLAMLAFLCAVGVAAAAGGHAGLDPAFGEGGVVRLVPPESAAGSPDAKGIQSFGPAPDGSTYVIAEAYICVAGNGCGYDYYLGRYGTDGGRDAGFGAAPGGFAPLPEAGHYSVVADEGVPLTVGFSEKAIVLRRFTAAGAPDPSFGQDGVAQVPCPCGGEDHLHVMVDPEGRIVIEVDQSRGEFFFDDGTHVLMYRLRSNGSIDPTFGTAGRTAFTIHGPGAPISEVTTAGGATLIGGSGHALEGACCGRRHIYLQRISAQGRQDRRFDHAAATSLKRIEIRGRFPTLTAVAAGSEGKISLLGYLGEGGKGFDLRLRADGRPDAGFGRDGLRLLSFNVRGASAGTDGAVFAVGTVGKYAYGGYFRAFRILAGGGLDPAYRRGKGIRVPLGGTRLAVTALAGGRTLVTDNGNSYCREGCPSVPAMARYLE